ncbi:MAG: cation:proton antiporter [Chloroflexia bacterium]
MENIDLLLDLALVMGAAILGGFAAHLFKQPAILGYLLAGVVIGPYTIGPVASVERVQTLANFGVALLMFALGTEFSLSALGKVRRVAVGGGIGQILLCMGLGTALGLTLGFSLTASIFLGGIISISSSIFILKILLSRDEVESIWGRITIGIGIVQDISMLALIVILPSLGSGVGWDLVGTAGFAVLRSALVLVVAYVIGTRVVPPVLARVARMGSRELFLLTIVAIAAGAAVLGQLVGISFALGAFVGGLITSESEFSHKVLDEIIPLREVFATLFFVSIGMLMDPTFLWEHLGQVSLMVGVIIIGKFAITYGLVRILGYEGEAPLRTGLLIAQIGEFSFVLASVGLEHGTIDDNLYKLVISSALVSLVLNPLLVNNASRMSRLAGVIAGPLKSLRRSKPAEGVGEGELAGLDVHSAQSMSLNLQTPGDMKRHVIVAGYGRVGQEIARAIKRRGFPCVVIDYNPARVEIARQDGCVAIQGDSTHAGMLEQAGIANARMVAATLPDLPSVLQIVQVARQLNPRVRVLARTHDARSIRHLKDAGAHEVVQPEFEAGLEMLRQALRSYGVSSLETQSIVGGRRLEHYAGGPPPETSSSEDSLWT